MAPSTFGLPPWAGQARRILLSWIACHRQRRQLAALDDAALKDMGLTRADVRIELDKPFWQL